MAPVDYLGFARAAQDKDPFSSLVKGYGMGQVVQQNDMKLQQEQMALQQTRDRQEALKGYAQTGDIQGAMQKDPATGMALQDRQMKVLSSAVALHDELKFSTYGNLENYNTKYRPEMLKLGVPPGMLPEYKTVEELNQGLSQKEMIAARLKGLLTQYQAGQLAYKGEDLKLKQQKNETDAQYKNRLAGLRELEVGLHSERLSFDKSKSGEAHGKWYKNSDGSRQYFTPSNPPPANKGWELDSTKNAADPDVAKDKIEKEIRTGFKFKDQEDGFKKQAEAEILKGQLFTHNPGTFKSNVQVPFAQLDSTEKGKVRAEYADQIAARTRKLYDAEVQRRTEAKWQKRQSSQPKGGGGGIYQVWDNEDKKMVNVTKEQYDKLKAAEGHQ